MIAPVIRGAVLCLPPVRIPFSYPLCLAGPSQGDILESLYHRDIWDLKLPTHLLIVSGCQLLILILTLCTLGASFLEKATMQFVKPVSYCSDCRLVGG